MGRVKSGAIKRVAAKLVEDHKNSFTKDFKKNKQDIQELVECEKKTKNKIAGHITRLKKRC